MSIIGAEDEDFENDLNDPNEDQCKHFNSIELLKERPTHLLVFMQHVILQFDPAPLLCYLHAELFKKLYAKDNSKDNAKDNAKEIKKQFVEFYNTFLDKGAVLRVSIPVAISNELDRTRADLISEDIQKRYVQEIQSLQIPEVKKQLEDFRHKRMMGMTQNEEELIDVENHYPTDRVPMKMKEAYVAETLLEKMSDMQPTIVMDEEKCQSIFAAVTAYMKHLDVKTRGADSKSKSKGMFFKRQTKTKKEDTPKKPKPFFPSIPPWRPSDLKSKTDAEVHPSRESTKIPVPEPPAPVTFTKKLSIIGSGESSDRPGNNGVNTSPEPFNVDGKGHTSNRLEPPSQSESGDVSPVGLTVVPCIGEPISPVDLPAEEPVEKERRKTSRKIGRSESARVDRQPSRRRGSSRAKQSRSRSDVDLQPPTASTTPPSPLTPQHLHPLEGPILAPEIPSHSPTSSSPSLEEIDPRLQELEQDPPNWREVAPQDAVKKLSKKEAKRQEVINELFATEHAHVRMLSVLQTVFSKPLGREQLLTADELETIFPSLDEIIELHYNFYENLKKLRLEDNFIVKTISTTVLQLFGGPEGEWFQKLTARFCSHQKYSLEQIKAKRKDPRFNSFILEAESKPQCRRLQLKDIIPTVMQRLTKYPLLLENIAKNTDNPIEKRSVEKSAECCKRILNHVNEEVKKMENLLILKEYQRKLDTSGLKTSNDLYAEYKNIDMTQRTMLYEGPLIWKVTREKAVDVQCVLLGDMLVLLQKQDDKMVLKCQSKSSSTQDGKQMLSPIIKLDSAFLRDVATDQKAFYVIFAWDSGAQIYELVAQTVGEKKTWTDRIQSAVDDLKKSGATIKLMVPSIGGGVPLSPTMANASLSPTDNGSLKISDQDKDGLTDDKSSYPRHRLMDFLSDNGFDLIAHSNSTPERTADDALDEVRSLKRLLIGSISLSEDSELDVEMKEKKVEEPNQEGDVALLTEESESTDKIPEEETGGTSESESPKTKENEEEDKSISAPLVLSQERSEEVGRRLRTLEEQIKRLQTVEEEHHKLQEALSKFSLERGNF
ncbi:Rho guanine nucleotide exchange factor 1 [Oryzias melastigma]|uniref:Rho guanine nucleotide exchange factor 1 n=1 Tax=Oryzias melastigma TaxID=30732 RepID=A0A834BSI9_ORYME|nr:Rho guanine nucleotide exchange factor 1 [Oryzias melastigma]